MTDHDKQKAKKDAYRGAAGAVGGAGLAAASWKGLSKLYESGRVGKTMQRGMRGFSPKKRRAAMAAVMTAGAVDGTRWAARQAAKDSEKTAALLEGFLSKLAEAVGEEETTESVTEGAPTTPEPEKAKPSEDPAALEKLKKQKKAK